MASVPTPELPQYRVTLFFGPEPLKAPPSRVCCVFNVKKRSWKGGVQIVVELEEDQLARARQTIGFEGWLNKVVDGLPEGERDDYQSRAHDLLVQGLCALKLDLAIDVGIRQENGCIAGDALVKELDQAVSDQRARIQSQILTELDLAEG
ncbi:MAG: hypothetical protein ACREI2_03185 [Nitrospiraceae bacterium]